MKSWFLRERGMSNSGYKIRPMKRDEMNLAVEWAAAEGWNPGLNDAEPFFAADPGGFLLGLKDGEPIAMISAVKYGNTFGFMGFYIVKPEWRGHGYGLKIWDAAVASLEGRNIGLDGVVDQQANYRKSGFSLAHRNIRYQWNGEKSADNNLSHGQYSVTSHDEIPIDTLVSFDRQFVPEQRSDFLRSWITQPHSSAMALKYGDKLVGYGVIRQCRCGFKVGPLFAETKDGASLLFCELTKGVEKPVFLDVPECNEDAVALAEEHGMEIVFETARMYTQSPPDLSIQKTYGITSFELG